MSVPGSTKVPPRFSVPPTARFWSAIGVTVGETLRIVALIVPLVVPPPSSVIVIVIV